MMESFWARKQNELLDPRRWRTPIEQAHAIEARYRFYSYGDASLLRPGG